RAIGDAGWYSFVCILRSVAEKGGVQVVDVDPRGTSQECVCGARVPKDLSVRWHLCPECGLSQGRDHVSARPYLEVGLARGLAWIALAKANVDPKVKRSSRSRRR